MKAKIIKNFNDFQNIMYSLVFQGVYLFQRNPDNMKIKTMSKMVRRFHIRNVSSFLKLRKHFNIYSKEEIIIVSSDRNFKNQLRYGFKCRIDDKIRFIHSEMLEFLD